MVREKAQILAAGLQKHHAGVDIDVQVQISIIAATKASILLDAFNSVLFQSAVPTSLSIRMIVWEAELVGLVHLSGKL